MKTVSYLLIAFIFGGLIFVKLPKEKKEVIVLIDTPTIISEKREFDKWNLKIKKQHQEMEAVLDSVN